MLITLSKSATGASSSPGDDMVRGLCLTNDGRVAFNARSGVDSKTLVTPLAYNDGRCHMATATFSSTSGSLLYMDGAPVASDATMTSANNYTGYWRIGYDVIPGTWSHAPTSNCSAGSVAHVVIYPTVLPASHVGPVYESGI